MRAAERSAPGGRGSHVQGSDPRTKPCRVPDKTVAALRSRRVNEIPIVGDLAETAFRRHYAQIYRYLRRKTGDHGRAEELTQEVFADAAAALGRFRRGPTPVLAWLYTVAARRFADEARRNAAARAVVPLEAVEDSAADRDYGARVTDALQAAISRLPAQQREVVLLKLVHGAPFREIAARVGTSEAACKMRFHRALEALRQELEREGVQP